MLSETHKKVIFIDFGLSRLIKEEVGYKSLTTFVGSINFCSEEMGRLMITKDARRIDFYYNDLMCLMGSLRSIRDARKINFFQEEPSPATGLKEFNHLYPYLLKFYLWKQQISDFYSCWDIVGETAKRKIVF